MYQSNRNLFKRMRNCFYDVHKWLDDVEVEQVVLKMSFLFWEMHQSNWEKLYYTLTTSSVSDFFFSPLWFSVLNKLYNTPDLMLIDKNLP